MNNLGDSFIEAYTPKDGFKEYHATGIDTWDACELLVDFLIQRFSAEVVEAFDGICSRTWQMTVKGLDFTVRHHDDIGNFFFTREDSEEHQRLMEAIADAMNSEFCAKEERAKARS